MQGVLLDQFGVLHDGKVAFPAAIEAVKQLAADSKKVFILSNSSRRTDTALQKISSLGFPSECFAGVSRPRRRHLYPIDCTKIIQLAVKCISHHRSLLTFVQQE
jgi:hypothetical protein